MRFPLAAAAGLFVVFGAFAQPVVVGRIPPEFGGTFPGAGPHTFVDLAHPANRDGNLTTASMVWSSFVPSPASCTAAFKIKILRRDTGLFFVVAERGPFAAQAGFATVTLSPPIPVLAGDLLAVVQLQEPPRHAAIDPVQRVAGGDVLELQQHRAGVDLHDVPDGGALRKGRAKLGGGNQRCRAGDPSNRGHG